MDTNNTKFEIVFDESNPNWNSQPEYNIMYLKVNENYLNDKLFRQGHLLLNDVLDVLGFKRIPEGCIQGWLIADDFRFQLLDLTDPSVAEVMQGRKPITITLVTQGVIYNQI